MLIKQKLEILNFAGFHTTPPNLRLTRNVHLWIYGLLFFVSVL